MVWKELLIGFAVAGAVATLVPREVFQAIFPSDLPAALLVPLQTLLAPVLAVLTFIGSMGNGPLAAVLAGHGVVFGALMVFLYSDFVVPPALKINANYYGWRFAGYLGLVFAAAAVVTGVIVHVLFALVGILRKVPRTSRYWPRSPSTTPSGSIWPRWLSPGRSQSSPSGLAVSGPRGRTRRHEGPDRVLVAAG